MKTRIFFIIGILLLINGLVVSKEAGTGNIASGKESINVLASPDLYNLVSKWAIEYYKVNPVVTINVIKSEGNNLTGRLKKEAGLCFMSADFSKALNNQSAWTTIVGRDIVVPVMNVKNPYLAEINRRGITSQEFARMFSNSENQNWGMLLGKDRNNPLHCYIPGNSSVETDVANFLDNGQFKMTGTKVSDDREMISAIQKDPYSLGFCKLTSVIDLNKNCLAENIKLVPIDKNGNGKIDYMEDIYDNLQGFTRGVWIGKYPKALSGNIYLVSPAKPDNESELGFLRWVLTDGQQYLTTNGFNDLVFSERQTQLAKLNNTAIYTSAPQNNTFAIVKVVLLVLIAFTLIGFVFDWVSRPFRRGKTGVQPIIPPLSPFFDEESVIVPRGLYFDKTHTWAFMEKDGTVKIGIDDFLQHITGPLSRIGMKPAGVKIKKGDPLLTIIQKGKQLIIYSPISGTITAYNKSLITDSSAVNAAPYTDGWVYMIEPTNWLREIQFLSMSDIYKTWLKDEFSRLKDFFARAIQSNSIEYAHIALQDGGALKDSILADLGPEVWEDFQTKFSDNTR